MSGQRKTIDAAGAPEAIGPYSHAVESNGLLFCSGQVSLDPDSGDLVGKTVQEQATQCLKNLEAVCEAAGTKLADAIRLTVFTTEMHRFAEINEAYAAFFGDDPPARAVVGVADLPKAATVEIDAIVAV
jgi:2-iminobutanoate/2-iminopropanoate deaminase